MCCVLWPCAGPAMLPGSPTEAFVTQSLFILVTHSREPHDSALQLDFVLETRRLASLVALHMFCFSHKCCGGKSIGMYLWSTASPASRALLAAREPQEQPRRRDVVHGVLGRAGHRRYFGTAHATVHAIDTKHERAECMCPGRIGYQWTVTSTWPASKGRRKPCTVDDATACGVGGKDVKTRGRAVCDERFTRLEACCPSQAFEECRLNVTCTRAHQHKHAKV